MKPETRKAKLAALLGIEFKKPPTARELIEQGTISREGEAVIAFGNRTQRFIQRECVQCGLIFAVNRSNISCCSDECRVHYALHKYGLIFDPTARTIEERWSAQAGGPEPLTVPTHVLPLLLTALQDRIHTELEQSSLSLDDLLDLSSIDAV